MKLRIIAMSCLLVVMFCSSCSVDDDPVDVDSIDRAIDDYFENEYDGWGLGNFGTTTPIIDNDQIEFGLLFTTSVDGYFNEIIIRLPQKNNAIRVTIWDISNDNIIRTEYLDVIKEGEFLTFNIEVVSIKANNKYGVTLNSNDYYSRSTSILSNYSNIPNENFKTFESLYRIGGEQIIPHRPTPAFYGEISFNFYTD